MTGFSDDLRGLRLGTGAGLTDEAFVARVMAACSSSTRAPSQARPRRISRWAIWTSGAVVAAAASLAIGLSQWRGAEPEEATTIGAIAARGMPDAGLTATVQAFVGHAAPGAPLALLEGATLHPGDGILVRYSNPSSREAYLMVFAVDEQKNVHWIHPAYLDEKSNPTSLKLEPRVTDRVLPEVAEPENPANGELKVYAVLTAVPLQVKSVERQVAESTRPVPELFPLAEVETWKCAWSAP